MKTTLSRILYLAVPVPDDWHGGELPKRVPTTSKNCLPATTIIVSHFIVAQRYVFGTS